MSKTLIVILAETRASELTFDNFKKNVFDELNSDLCVCIGVKPDYDYENPFYKLAKYKFLYDEPEDFGDAFEYAYNILSKDTPKYEKFENLNGLHGQIETPRQSTDNITYYGSTDEVNLEELDDDEIIVHTKDFENNKFKDQVYGIKKVNNLSKSISVIQKNVITYKKPKYWRDQLQLQKQIWGGVKCKEYKQHDGSAGILIFFRWFLLHKLKESNLINEYDRFVITRSDFIYLLPHPKICCLDENSIWIPNCEKHGGYTDRHVILSKNTIEPYLNIFNNFVYRSNEIFQKIRKNGEWNLEKLIKFTLEQNDVIKYVQEFPYVMYSVRGKTGTTRWRKGDWNKELGYHIKYKDEWNSAKNFKNEYEKSGLSIDDYYKEAIIQINEKIKSRR